MRNQKTSSPGTKPVSHRSQNFVRQAASFAILAFAVNSLISTAAADDATQPSKPEVVYLWPAGSPTLQGADEKKITTPPHPSVGQRINSIKNVHNPSIEVHLPTAEKANGTAIIIAPGG